MGPTSKIMRQAGVEDGLAGARVVGNTDNYLAGYAEGELQRRKGAGCPGKKYEERQDSRGPLFRCTTCHRVNRTTRDHQPPGRTTASHDKTMGTLWDMSAPKEG